METLNDQTVEVPPTESKATLLTVLNLVVGISLAYGFSALLLGKPGLLNPILAGTLLGYLTYGRETLLLSDEDDAGKLAQLYGAFGAGMIVVLFIFGLSPVSLILTATGFALGYKAVPSVELNDGQPAGSVDALRGFILALTSIKWWQMLSDKAILALVELKQESAGIPAKAKVWYADLVKKFTPQSVGDDPKDDQ
jgi:hypothetical protein